MLGNLVDVSEKEFKKHVEGARELKPFAGLLAANRSGTPPMAAQAGRVSACEKTCSEPKTGWQNTRTSAKDDA